MSHKSDAAGENLAHRVEFLLLTMSNFHVINVISHTHTHTMFQTDNYISSMKLFTKDHCAGLLSLP